MSRSLLTANVPPADLVPAHLDRSAVRLAPLVPVEDRFVAIAMLGGPAFVALSIVGVIRRWRWVWWLCLIAFSAAAVSVVAEIV